VSKSPANRIFANDKLIVGHLPQPRTQFVEVNRVREMVHAEIPAQTAGGLFKLTFP
jgi:hypothetical protein